MVDIKAVEARWEKATPGPWEWDDEGQLVFAPIGDTHPPAGGLVADLHNGYFPQLDANGTFIAHSWHDVKDLLATVRELREALGAVIEPFAAECRNDEVTGFCLEHGTLSTLPDGECPVSRARRLLGE